MPQVVNQKSNIKLFVENLIDDYGYNFETKIQEQYDKFQINFLHIELVKIKLFELNSTKIFKYKKNNFFTYYK